MSVAALEDIRSSAPRREPETVDPVLTEVVRHGLNATAEQIKVTLCRTAFTPVIYEMIDFAAGLYDPDFRMLAQARALPQFLGTLSFCLEAAVERLGGMDHIYPGDIIWSTDGYDNGSHPQDAVVIVPAFRERSLMGFAITKAHHLDIAAKDPYCTDTTDNFQEGVIFPAVKVYSRGELQDDMYRTMLANSRTPEALEGDFNAQISAGQAGASGLLRMIDRHGEEAFWNAVEAMYNHGEESTRRFLRAVPDGTYTAECLMDDNGVDPDPVRFAVSIDVQDDEAVVDFSDCPGEQGGPDQLPPADHRRHGAPGHHGAPGRRRPAERGAFPPDIGAGQAALHVLASPAGADLPLRLGPGSGHRGYASRDVAGASLSRAGRERRGPMRPHPVGNRRRREVLDHGNGSPCGPRRLRPDGRHRSAVRDLVLGHSYDADGGCRVPEPPDRRAVRASARLLRRRQVPGRMRG